jgi:hypothetical protein
MCFEIQPIIPITVVRRRGPQQGEGSIIQNHAPATNALTHLAPIFAVPQAYLRLRG